MFIVDNITLDRKIADTHFACDLSKCKGACCTLKGRYGAPVLHSEVSKIEECLSAVTKYLPYESKKIISNICFVERQDGSYTTLCIKEHDCIFVYYEGRIAKCSLEKAYLNGESNFRKPISCHLFPIRVSNGVGKHLYYENIGECKPGIEKGNIQNIMLIDSVKDALIREFGKAWYDRLKTSLNND